VRVQKAGIQVADMTRPRHRNYRHVKALLEEAQLNSEQRGQLMDRARTYQLIV